MLLFAICYCSFELSVAMAVSNGDLRFPQKLSTVDLGVISPQLYWLEIYLSDYWYIMLRLVVDGHIFILSFFGKES